MFLKRTCKIWTNLFLQSKLDLLGILFWTFFQRICSKFTLFILLVSTYDLIKSMLWKTKCLELYLCFSSYLIYSSLCFSYEARTYLISKLFKEVQWSKNYALAWCSISLRRATIYRNFHAFVILSSNPSSPRERYLSYTLSLVLFSYLPIMVHFLPYLSTKERSWSTSSSVHGPRWFKAWYSRQMYL